MKAISIYHNPRCQKSREALKILSEKDIKPNIIEYLKNTPSEKELYEVWKILNIPIENMIRKKEPLYIEKYANKKYTEKEWLKILSLNPILIERPIVIFDNKAIIARPPVNILEFLE